MATRPVASSIAWATARPEKEKLKSITAETVIQAARLPIATAISEVNSAICKGCGSCSGACPSGAAKVRHFTDKQIFAEIDGLLFQQGA